LLEKLIGKRGSEKRIELIRGLDKKDVKLIADHLPLMNGAKELVKKMKDSGWIVVSVSGGFNELAHRVKDELGLDAVFCNEFIYNDDHVSDIKLNVTSNKVDAIESSLGRFNYKKEETIAIVDGMNDKKLFDISGLNIAFNAQEEVKKDAQVILNEKDLKLLIPYLEKHFNLK